MAILFQILSLVFYFLTLLIGILMVRGEMFLEPQLFSTIKMIAMPGYLLFCGIMMGYLIALIRKNKGESTKTNTLETIFKKSFLIGVGIGLILALSYTFI